MRRQRSDWEQMLETLAQLYIEGQTINWSAFDEGNRRTRMALPTYPFERQRYWLAGCDTGSGSKIWMQSTAAALSQSKLVPIGLKIESFAGRWKCLQRLTVAKILETLREFGAFAMSGSRHDAKSLTQTYGILPLHRKLIHSWLNLLCEAGYLERDGAEFKSREPLPAVDSASAWREAETALRDDPFLLEYLRNCSKHLMGVLVGTTSPLETLFPNESPDLARNLYEHSGGTPYANQIVAAAVKAACIAAPANRRLRVLELGAGTGATTAAILPQLLPERVSYCFTDVSEVFLQRADVRFAAYPFVRYGLLDIENEEHLARHAGSFDVVVAANVVHATRDLLATLSGITRLLVPGGTLVLLETTTDLAWHDITIGLTRGWQKHDDDLRTDSGLLGVEEWTSALGQAGFEEVICTPEAGSPAKDVGLHVIMGRRPDRELSSRQPATFTGSDLEPAWSRAADAELSASITVPSIQALLREALPAERHGILLDAVCGEIASVLRLPADAKPKKRDRLMDLGMDSLMAVELRNRLGSRLGLDTLPATLMFDYPTPDAIAGYLLRRFADRDAAVDDIIASAAPASQEQLLSVEQVDELSEEDVATLLRSRLAR